MSDVHAGPFHPVELGRCGYRHHFCGVWLSCDDAAVPGTDWCTEHFIAAVADREPYEGRP